VTNSAVDALLEHHPALSVVVNNAVVQTPTDLLAEDPHALRASLRREIAVNIDAVVAVSAGLLPHLARQPEAAIVNITTGLALAPKRSAPVCCATKSAVRTFTRALRYQCEDATPALLVDADGGRPVPHRRPRRRATRHPGVRVERRRTHRIDMTHARPTRRRPGGPSGQPCMGGSGFTATGDR
jgi:NAD(P)-dependent dehydrogenase (short-subunit alcohol dehydrogenase family)